MKLKYKDWMTKYEIALRDKHTTWYNLYTTPKDKRSDFSQKEVKFFETFEPFIKYFYGFHGKTDFNIVCDMAIEDIYEIAHSDESAFENGVSTNTNGGKQTELTVNLTSLPSKAVLEVGKIVYTGEKKYGKNNWRLIEAESHVNHALYHLHMYLAGDRKDKKHLVNATCRSLFALEQVLDNKP